jgi:ABC-type transport system involved in Fe-S cluster assembly, permease component
LSGESSEAHYVRISADEKARAAHIFVQAEANSHATLVIDHQGHGKLAENVEIVVGQGAHLNLITIQDWDATSVHVSNHFAKLEKDSYLKHFVVSMEGQAIRVVPQADLSAPGSNVEMFGVYLADSHQYIEHRPFVDHNSANCRSRVTYKGALQGAGAHTVWIGDVLIREAGVGTDTYELNRNLLLTDGARADSVPNLEIETGKIEGAGHASASGRFDDEQLFYLQSRGIDEQTARKLVVRGFPQRGNSENWR